MERREVLDIIYKTGEEDSRLIRNRQGQLEYFTTMHYIERFSEEEMKIIELGAGTGRYSIPLAKQGMNVTAVELMDSNLEVFMKNAEGVSNLQIAKGDAINLGDYADNSFDLVLSLGPMYHLFDAVEINKAIDEAIRIAKPGAIIMFAFLSIYGLMYSNYLNEEISFGIEENFDQEFKVKHFADQGFTAYDIEEFEQMFTNKSVNKEAVVGIDSIMELAEKNERFELSDQEFHTFLDYHLRFCEKRELLGANSHILYICRKNK